MNEIMNIESEEKNVVIETNFDYSGYQVVRGEFFSHLFEPSITFNNDKVSVNTACINKIPNAEYVQILVNPMEKKLAVKPCSEDKKDSFCWVAKGNDGKRKPKAISCQVFCAKVINLMGWNKNCRYKILGKLVRTPLDTLFVFDLKDAETYEKKKTDGSKRQPLYPENWKDQFGVSVEEHADSIMIEIFDDYAVFRIDKEEEKNGKTTVENDIGSEEEKNQDFEENISSIE